MTKEYIVAITNDVIHDGFKRFEDEYSPQQELVRCKDCKHGEKANDVYLCGKLRGFGLAHEPSWFCADGERKEGR